MHRAFAAFWLVVSLAQPLLGATIFFDDFNDGSVADGSPAYWSEAIDYSEGTFNAIGGDYVLTGSGSGNALVAYVSQPSEMYPGISLRTQVRTDGGVDGVAFLARLDLNAAVAYQGGIASDGTVYLGWNNPTYHRLDAIPTALGVTSEDIMLQFDVFGDSLRLYAWRAGEPMPSAPTVQASDQRFITGGIGILNDPQGATAATFGFVHAATHTIKDGDATDDGIIDLDDLNAVRNNFGSGDGSDQTGIPGDTVPFDGLVNLDDLNAVRNLFGTGTSAIPEPSTFAIAGIALLGMLKCRRLLLGAAVVAMLVSASNAYAVPIGRFVDVQPVIGVNTASFEWAPIVSNDGLELFFSSNRADPEFAMYRATRMSISDPFGNVTRLDSINSVAEDDPADISPDGLTLYFASERAGGEGSFDLYAATRPALDQPFGDVTSLGKGVNGPFDDGSARVSTDGLSMVFHSLRPGEGGYDVYTARRTDTNEAFSDVQPLAGVNSALDEFRPALSANGLTLFFSDFLTGQRPGGAGFIDLWVTSRDATSDPFGEPVNLNNFSLGSEINTNLGETLAYVSRDWPAHGSKMYFVRGTGDGTDIYEATWVPEPASVTLAALLLASSHRLASLSRSPLP